MEGQVINDCSVTVVVSKNINHNLPLRNTFKTRFGCTYYTNIHTILDKIKYNL